jgi:hypothetical protein
MSWPLLTLHLSDLHFGPHGRFEGEHLEALARRFHQAIEEARQELGWKERVGLCIVTGDIAEAARQKEYKEALAFFEALVGCLGLERSRVIFVPGNHDVSWTLTKKLELDQEEEGFDDAELERRIQQQKFQHFEGFLHEFYGKDRASLPGVQSLGHEAFLHTFPEERLAVAVLNSCERESHRHQGGILSGEQAQALMNQWHGGEARHWLKVIAIHHNPVATVPENAWPWVQHLQEKEKAGKGAPLKEWLGHFLADTAGFEGREHLRKVAEDCQVQLILHGHHHAEERIEWPWKKTRGRTSVLSTGSLSLRSEKLPADQPNMLHLLRLDPTKREMASVFRIYEPRARAEGSVKSGHFTVDAANPKGSSYDLSPPQGCQEQASPPDQESTHPDASKVQGFIREYRTRLKRRYDRLDLRSIGAVQPGGAGKPIDAGLDEMYLPLRLAEGFNPEKLNAGQVLTPDALLSRKTPLVIRGAAGSGKTTWMRWTFRRLMEMAGALPFLVELRGLARAWDDRKAQGEERTLDAYLRTYVSESGAGGWQEALSHVLQAETGPRPVLLVDGWDELGEMGEELREKLKSFLDAHPRVLAVVSSRPYGQSQPSHSDGFELLDLQPLSDAELARFISQFHHRVYSEDETTAQSSSERIQEALKSSPEALSLARTPLLLTMMLLISRDRPLPDKRHRLYEECIRNLLSARPEQKEREGARLQSHQWRPTDSEERLRVVATLAARIQQEGYGARIRVQIVRSWEEFEGMLPNGWKRDDKRGFLAWLVGAAGVMIDRTDETLSFAHLSFQEYLTAQHLAASTEGTEARLQLCRERMHDRSWWETLRLWAAIVWDRNPEHLKPVLQDLIEGEQPAGYWLAGAILADGPGEEDTFESWCEGLYRRFHAEDMDEAQTSAWAWRASRQDARRRAIAQGWSRLSESWTWLQAGLSESWDASARLDTPDDEGNAFTELVERADHKQGVARAKVLFGAHPTSPQSPLELVLLRLVPTPRILASARLQLLISLRVPPEEFDSAARHFLTMSPARGQSQEEARDWAREFVRDMAPNWASPWLRDLARELAQHWRREWIQDWARGLTLDLAQYWTQGWIENWALNWAREWAGIATQYWAADSVLELAKYWAVTWTRTWGLERVPAWLVDSTTVEIHSPGRVGTRVMIAHAPDDPAPHSQLLKAACQISLHPDADPTALNEALASYPSDGDPLWPALARHLTRRSTDEDCALLIGLTQHPEKREAPLSWGLKYYLRGDLVLEDGSEVTLDELCARLELPPLPYLEDMPPEIEVDWEKKEEA